MSLPLVSICIPTYNGEKFIAEAMDSAITQTYDNLEIVVSDDASKDATLTIIASYKTKTNIPIRVYKHKPNGIGANWNHSIQKAQGAYIKFLFQDDVLAPNCIAEMVAVMQADSTIGLVASKRDFIIDESFLNKEAKLWIDKYADLQSTLNLPTQNKLNIIDNTLFKTETFLKSPLNKIGEPTVVLFRKDIVKEVGYFDESLMQILDYEYWNRILKHKKIAILNEKLVTFRLHANQATNVNRNQEISDYKLYERLLYKQYFKLLRPNIQRRLLTKYNLKYKIYYWGVNKARQIVKLLMNA